MAEDTTAKPTAPATPAAPATPPATPAKVGVVESEDGTLSSAARAPKHEDPADNSVGNEGDDVSPAPEGTPVDAPGQPEGEKLHVPGAPHNAGNPIARAVIYDVRHLIDHIEGKDVDEEIAEAEDAKKEKK